MGDHEYNKKLESLQRYIPFLAKMMNELKAKGNREAQLNKFQSLHDIITDTKKKLKIETLAKCEEVLTNIYVKVNGGKIGSKFNSLPGIEGPTSTPQSPSPPRDIVPTKPVTIPTEKVVPASTGVNSFGSALSYQRPKVNVYSNVVLKPPSAAPIKSAVVSAKVPDMSKPPISLDDLKTLEDEVEQKITFAAYQSKSVDELQEVKKQLQLQLKVEEISSCMSSNEPINTTVRNTPHLSKRRISLSTEKKSKTSPVKEIKSPPPHLDKKSSLNKGKVEETKPAVKLGVKETDLFGNLLSSIDSKILEEKKVSSKKGERRLSATESGEAKDDHSKKSKSSHKDKSHSHSKDEKKKHKSRDRSSSSKHSSSSSKSEKSPKKSAASPPPDSITKLLEDEMRKTAAPEPAATSAEPPKPTPAATTTTYKRLADKYNPKPKPKTTEVEVDKAVEDNIEQQMKTSPVKTLPVVQNNVEAFNKPVLNTPVHNTPVLNKPVQLPDILQKIFSKPPIQEDIVPKQDPRLESLAFKSVHEPVGVEPSLHKPLHFEPPRFVSPPRVAEPILSPNIILTGSQQPPPRICAVGTPRADFDAPTQDLEPHNRPYNVTFVPPTPPNPFAARTPPNAFVAPNSMGYMPQVYQQPQQHEVYNRYEPRFYGQYEHQYYPDRFAWGRDRRPGDPRNYGEYRQMKERQAQAQSKDVKDPRLAARDPRLSAKEAAEPQKEAAKEARLIKSAEKNAQEGPREPISSSKFDKIYSKTNAGTKTASNKPGGFEEEESFTSPLDSLYNAGEKSRTGRGYGMQTFRIPKKSLKRDEALKERGEAKEEVKSEKEEVRCEKEEVRRRKKQVPNEKKRPVILSDSEESDAGADDAPPDDDDDDEEEPPSVKEDSCTAKLGIDTSRIKVVISPKTVGGAWGTLKSPTAEDFVSEYDKECGAEPEEVPEEPSSTQDQAKPAGDLDKEQQESGKGDGEPLEQNILAHFFENLLKSSNKKDKKTALFSLIETFSDSFDNKQIQKIRKIIRVNEDEEDEASDDGDGATPALTAVKESAERVTAKEEVPVVGSTTEEDVQAPAEDNKSEEGKATQVNEISKSGTEEANLQEVDAEEDEEHIQDSLEPVMVSVGERIKNRKRATTPKNKKKYKSELDHLHDDIKDMFIRDGVLTASGKRMCRMLKDDPNALINTENLPVTTPPAEPKKERKKPGPKPKAKRFLDTSSMKDVRVLLAKIPEPVPKPSRMLRSRSKKNSYSEMDDEELETAATKSSESESESELDTSSGEDSDPGQSKEGEAPGASEEAQQKPRKRRKTPRWASGIITKVKKKKPPSRLSNKSPDGSPDRIESVRSDSEGDKLVEPDKDYYIDYTVKEKVQCKLCKYTGLTMTSHYLKEHPHSEVLSSRFAPAIATAAVKDFLQNGTFWESINNFKISHKYQYCCRMCGYASTVLPLLFYEHVTTHTGEYRHQCGVCEFTAANSKTMAAHFVSTHPDQERKTIKSTYSSAIIFAYMCGECNFVQLNRKSVEDHANIFHLGDKAAIFKINMSSVLDPQLKAVEDVEEPPPPAETPSPLKKKTPGPKSKTEPAAMRKKPGPKSKTVPPLPLPEQEPAPEIAAPIRRKPGPKSKTQKPESAAHKEEVEVAQALAAKEVLLRKRKRSLEKLIPEDSEDDLDSIITFSIRSSRAAKEKATAKLKSLMESNDSSPVKRKPSETETLAEPNRSEEALSPRDKSPPRKEETPPREDPGASTSKSQVAEMRPPSALDARTSVAAPPENLNIFTCKNDIMQEEAKKIEKERLQKMDELNKSIGSRTSNLDFVNKLSNRLTQEETVFGQPSPVIKQEPVDQEEAAPVLEPQVPAAPPLKKPVFEEQPPTQPHIQFRQDKPNKPLFSDMIEKLRGKVNEAAVQQQEDAREASESRASPVAVLSIGDLIRATKYPAEDVVFSCHAANCHVKTKDRTVFLLHCKFGHKNFARESSLCDKCGVVVAVTPDTTLLENLYDHLLFAHSDFVSEPTLSLKMRRLSGDKLSVVKKEIEKPPEEQQEPVANKPAAAEAVVNEAPLQLAEDNPFSFKIASVMSLAEAEPPIKPPPLTHVPPLTLIGTAAKQQTHMVVKEAKQTVSELVRAKKTPKAMRKFLETPGDLYKCPHFYCQFSTNVRTLLGVHLKQHKADPMGMVPCVYCDMKTPWEHVPMHIDIRHANSRFSCKHCLYRAVYPESVCLHMEVAHPDAEYTILELPPHKSAKKFAVTDKVDIKSLCQPYRCSCADGVNVAGNSSHSIEYLFVSEYVNHLTTVHKGKLLRCGYAGCKTYVNATQAVNHWSQSHGVCMYQCGYCKTGNNEVVYLYPHFAQSHAHLAVDILVRKIDTLPLAQEFRFTEEAFKRLQHKREFPADLLTTIGKRGKRSIKLIEVASPNAAPEVLTPQECPSVLKPASVLNAAPTASTSSSASLGTISTPQLLFSNPTILNNFLVTSSTGSGETLLLLPLSAPLLSSGQTITSTAPVNKGSVQTITASTKPTNQEKEPVRIGNITLYPGNDPSAVELPASTATMISQPIAVASAPLFSTAPIRSLPEPPRSKDTDMTFEEDTTSQNTGTSEEDILQSAIRSILDDDDSLTRPEPPASGEAPPPPLTLLNNAASKTAPLEHVDLGKGSLNLEANEEFSNFSDDAFISSNSLDPFVEDPLSIEPTLNVDLPAADDRSAVSEAAAVKDALQMSAVVAAKEATVELPSPAMISNMRRSASTISVSDEESDGGLPDKKKCGLMGYQLFRCSCNSSFSNVKLLKIHLKTCSACKKTGLNLYQCVHCDKCVKSVQRLCEHIMTHGVQRFSCSLCEEKFTIVNLARLHMKNRHGIGTQQTRLVPLQSDQTDLDAHEFVVKPAQMMPFSLVAKENHSPSDNIKSAVEDSTYLPDQIDILPIRQIFSSNVKCGLCNYQTKVRVNIIRHLQMHLDEKAVPDTAPVNPVPCLEKNEKMFDKMINLAASSFSTSSSRMGGPATKEKEDEKHPEFVPARLRFVCCAPGCTYMCPEEGNLKHHLMALHSDESVFTCAHCKAKIETTEIETVIKHFKLHSLHLYKCQYCSFVHHLKHKVERHVSDTHSDVAVKVVTVRAMDSEPVDATQEDSGGAGLVSPAAASSLSKFKPWSCCMCKAKYHTQQEIQSHAVKKHNVDTQYKCTLCSFKNDEEANCRQHFKEKHSSHAFDIVLVYQKLEEELPKEDVAAFDTTPLWQRDKPRVRHIRGILFEEDEPLPPTTKSPKKKTYPTGASHKLSSTGVSPAKTPSTGVSPAKAPPTSVSTSARPSPLTVAKNIFDCIDAVARGTADALLSRPGPSGVSSKKSTTPNKESHEKVTSSSSSGTPSVEVAPKENDDDVILLPNVPNVIVIDSESDTEEPTAEAPNPTQVDDDVPKTKDKDSKTKPVAKNRQQSVKRSASDLMGQTLKLAKIDDSSEDQKIAESCRKENLVKMFGELGAPYNKQWRCPLCDKFKSKRVGDFVFHMYKDLKKYRYYCKICQDKSITYKYMQEHLNLHPGRGPEIVEILPVDPKLDAWMHMVIREQSLKILDKSPLFKKRPVEGPSEIACYFCNETFSSMADCCEHMLYHWVMMPYQCHLCRNEFYTVYDLKHHFKIEHPDAKPYLEPKGPTISKAFASIENFKKRLSKPQPVCQPQAAKRPRLEPEPADPAAVIVLEDPEEPPAKPETPPPPPTTTAVQSADEVFACNVCVHVADSEPEIQTHIHDKHGVKKGKLFHVLSKSKAELETTQKFACNICNEIFTELKLRLHFARNHMGSSYVYLPYRYQCALCVGKFLTPVKIRAHFSKKHPGEKFDYKTVVPTLLKGKQPKDLFKYSCPMCTYVSFAQSPLAVKTHLRSHLRPIKCDRCDARFRYHSEIVTHFASLHGNESIQCTVLENVIQEYVDIAKAVVASAKSSAEAEITSPDASNVSGKSVNMKPVSRDPSLTKPADANKEPDMDLSKIVTTFELDDLEYTTSAEQCMKMFNMNSYVDVSDCWVETLTFVVSEN